IQFARQTLLTKSQDGVEIGIDADIQRRLKRDPPLQSISFKAGTKGAKDGTTCLFFCDEFHAAYKAVCESHTAILEAQRADHTVPAQPMAITYAAERHSRRPVQFE